MRPSLKAFLLSAFIFPGLGQLYKQDRRKGIILLFAANLLLALVVLAGVMVLSEIYMTSVYPEALNTDNLRPLMRQVAARPLFYIPAALLLAVWGFSAADALVAAIPSSEEN
jgi:hypothetical protein